VEGYSTIKMRPASRLATEKGHRQTVVITPEAACEDRGWPPSGTCASYWYQRTIRATLGQQRQKDVVRARNAARRRRPDRRTLCLFMPDDAALGDQSR
jgi:hypothetical protein